MLFVQSITQACCRACPESCSPRYTSPARFRYLKFLTDEGLTHFPHSSSFSTVFEIIYDSAISSAHRANLAHGFSRFPLLSKHVRFSKAFAAASYSDDITWLGLELKTAFVLAQLFGYILSKFVGIWWLSARVESGRFGLLMRLMFVAYAALIAFYLLPTELKPLAMLVNGMPLGMIWGVVISYLEGRRQSDTLLVMLASSFVIATSLTKDVGLWVMNSFAVDPYLMPVVVATLFYPLLAASDLHLRNRQPLPRTTQLAALSARRFHPLRVPNFSSILAWSGRAHGAFMLLTAFRDFRDNFGIEIISNSATTESQVSSPHSTFLLPLSVS